MIGQAMICRNNSATKQLVQQLRNSFKGLNQQRWHTSKEVFPEKKYQFGFDRDQVHKTKQSRNWYESPISNATKKRFQTIDFRNYQKNLEEAAQKRIEGLSLEEKVEEVIIEKDQIFGDEPVPKRYYDRVLQKELYFHHRSNQNYVAYADRKIDFLTDFKPSFEKIPEFAETLKAIHNLASSTKTNNGQPALSRAGIDQEFIIEDDFYATNPECKELFETIASRVQNTNYRLLPELGLVLSFKLRYNKDVFGIWKKIEQSFTHSIHHYPITELVKMRYASCGLFPKSLSKNCLNSIQDIVFSELHNIPSILDLSHTLFAFRHMNSLKNYNLLLDEITKRPVKTLQDAIALLFVFSHALYPNYKRKQIREKNQDLKEKFKIIDHIADALASNAKQIEGDDVVRVLIGLNNLQVDTFKDVLHHLERYVIKNADNLDAFQTAGALYGFSKANNNKGFGSEQLYKALQKAAEKHWSSFSNIEKAKTFYAFTSQGQLDQVFRKKFIAPWLAQTLQTQLNHSDLHYVAFSLLFEGNKDEETWKKVVKNVVNQRYVVPVQNYYPLKLALFYIQNLFPKWQMDGYKIACQEAESTWNASRQIDSMMENAKEWKAIGYFLQNRLEYNSVGLDNFENLLLIDWAIMPQKVAIMIQGERQTLPNGKPTPLHQLKLQLLESKHFGVLNLVFSEFENVPADQKESYLKQKIEALLAKQEAYIKDVEEPKEWYKFMGRMQEFTYRNIMLGEAKIESNQIPEIQEISFDWSKLQDELAEYQKTE